MGRLHFVCFVAYSDLAQFCLCPSLVPSLPFGRGRHDIPNELNSCQQSAFLFFAGTTRRRRRSWERRERERERERERGKTEAERGEAEIPASLKDIRSGAALNIGEEFTQMSGTLVKNGETDLVKP